MKNLVFIFMCLFFVIPVQAEIIYVDENTPNNSDGSSWTNAYKFLQDALAAANTGDEIWIAQGTYRPDEDSGNPGGTGSRTATFQLINSVALYSGFPSGGGLWTSRNPDIYKTILSGDLNGDDGLDFINNGENSYSVVTGSGTDATAILDGFTITAGNADGPGQYDQDMGGGMVNYESSPTVTNCTFSGNSAGWCGGGMFNDNSSPMLANCTFSGNSSDLGGGGMVNFDSNPMLTNCTFSRNSADVGGGICNRENSSPTLANCTFSGNSSDLGGGMVNYESSPTLTNCSFTGNSASSGGGMWNYENSNPVLTNCTFSGNSAQSAGGILNSYNSNPTIINCTFCNNSVYSYGAGGGMHNNESSPMVTNCTFSGNSAGWSGGGIFNFNSSPTLTNCTFSENSTGCFGGGMSNRENSSPTLTNCSFTGNSASDKGGGMFSCYDSTPTLANCSFTGNSASSGGGMCNYYNSSPTLTNCIFSGNSTSLFGGGIYNWDNSSSALTNCILWGNAASDEPQMHNDGTSSIIVSYSDVQDSWPGTGNIDADPRFIEPGYWDPNGTLADANDDIWVDGDYHLLPDSPCIDAGDPNYIPEPNETDLDGNPRINGGRIDMGAYETIQHEARLWIWPRVINRRSHQPRIMAWMRLSQGITKEQVNDDKLLILNPGGIEASHQFVIQSRGRFDRHTYVFAFFDKAELMDAVPENGQVELQVVGQLKPGQYFYGTDTVRIITPWPRRRWPFYYWRY